MRILAVVADASRRHLEQALLPSARVLPDRSEAAALHALRTRGCDALVIDPTLFSADVYERLLAAVAASPVPVIVYAPLSGPCASRVLQIAELGPHEIILRGIDDDAELIKRKLASLLIPSVPSVLLSRAATHFRRFPEALQTASVELFGAGPLPRWVDELAARAQLGRRTVDRWMWRSGLSGASMLLDAARLARAWEPLAEHRKRPADVALALGYSRLRLLTSHTRRLTGVVPANLGRTISREEFTTRLARALIVQ